MASNSKSETFLQRNGYDFLLGSIAAFYVLTVPYTKVEESFNVQYDHLEFPGVVPRTFLGALLVSLIAAPFVLTANLLHLPKFYALLIVRMALGCIILYTLRFFRHQIRNKFGHQVEAFFVILTATQFHFLFYCTRPLPNILALGLVNLAYGYWFRGRFYAALNSLIFTTTVFRCDMLLLLCPIGLQLLLTKKVSVWGALKHCTGMALFCIGLTILVDSIMWKRLLWPEFEVFWFNSVLNKSSEWGVSCTKFILNNCIAVEYENTCYTYFMTRFQLLYVDRDIIKVGLPFRGGYGLHLNYVLSSIASLDVVKLYSAPSHNSEFLWVVILFYFFWKSWDYSDLCFETHAFHWYFTSALPRSLLAAFPLSLFGLFVDRRVRSFTFPVLAFILLYSKLPHKELRFIISSVPIFNLSASIASNRIYNNKKKMVWNLLFLILLGLLLMSLAGTVTSFMASYWNYPSGHALKKLHGIGFHNDTDERWVHIDTFSAMNGISRFCESDFPWRYLSVRKAGSGGLDNVAEVCNLLSQVQYEVKEPKVYAHGNLENQNLFSQNWPGCP
ncbi:hypothetical protein JHK87_018186 [Glycine soja]|nr:hypothetical protein JHK87_018186 [Glycine soja]